MSSPPCGVPLSRAISNVDLNAALEAVQTQVGTGLCYTKDSLLSLRPKSQTKQNAQHVEVTEVASSLDGEGLITPPGLTCPKPPPPTPATPENGVQDAGMEGAKSSVTVAEAAPTKKKKKSSGRNKKAPATGFEEFYADPPITPDEHEEESDLYDETRPFPARIESCIQRYRARRKLDEVRSNILTKYFMLGGIDATAKTFTGGLDQQTLENSTAAEIAAIQASDFVHVGKNNAKYYDGSDGWVIDFEGVAKGFFSHRVPYMFPLDTEKDIMTISNVIRNFLNYVLQHAVCPEYTEDVMAARRICELAERELWAIKQLNWYLPGDFNVAASSLYGGRYQGMSIANAEWEADDPNFQDFLTAGNGFSGAKAERIFKTGIAFAGDDALFVETMKAGVHIVKTENKFYEVVCIERASLQSIEEYATIKDHDGNAGNIKALGVIKFKAWNGPGFDEEDITDDEAKAARLASEKSDQIIESFWLEDEILQYCFVGMKLEVTVRELNIGIKFFDLVNGVYCSFHVVLPNEKMAGWKEPVPNTRPPPTIEDPDIEERAMESIMKDEMKAEEKEFETLLSGKK